MATVIVCDGCDKQINKNYHCVVSVVTSNEVSKNFDLCEHCNRRWQEQAIPTEWVRVSNARDN